MTDLATLKARLLEDPETRAEYEALAPEFEVACELIAARFRAARGKAMSAFASVKQGLTEAAAHARGAPVGVVAYRPQAVDVGGLRRRLGLTQDQFAARFGFSVATLRHWERGDRKPQGAALVLLHVIERNPKAVLEALAAS